MVDQLKYSNYLLSKMKAKNFEFFVWFALPVLNFLCWFYIAQKQSSSVACSEGVFSHLNLDAIEISVKCPLGTVQNPRCNTELDHKYLLPSLETVNSREFDLYRAATLAPMGYDTDHTTLLLKMRKDDDCSQYYHQISSQFDERQQCFAVVRLNDVNVAFNVQRFEFDIDESGLSKSLEEHAVQRRKDKRFTVMGNVHNLNRERPTGYFRKVPGDRGRERVQQKMTPFLRNFNGPSGIVTKVKLKLEENGFSLGENIVVMVVNEGEIDLYLNFACSCHQHDISTGNILVFAASR